MLNKEEFLANRIEWRSPTSFIIVTAGAVIGLANFWEFPQLVSQYGGNFFWPYLLSLFLIGAPAMFAETIIGRRARQNQVSTMEILSLEADRSMFWRYLGWWGAIALLLLASFYSVLSCLTVDNMQQLLLQSGTTVSSLSHPLSMLGWNSFLILITGIILAIGIRYGLEPLSYFTIGALFVILVSMVVVASLRYGLSTPLHNMVTINPAGFTPRLILSAIGYAFFTLSLGGGTILVYGSYIPNGTNVSRSLLIVILLDILAGILAYLAITPLLHGSLAHLTGIEALYNNLPKEFAQAGWVHFEGVAFYLVVFLAAWTSLIAFLEPLVIIVNERFNIRRKFGAWIISAMIWFLGLGTILSFNVWQKLHIIGSWNFYELISTIGAEIMLPLGSLGFCIFAGWRMLPRTTAYQLQKDRHPYIYHTWRFLVRYVAPIGILLLFI